MTRLLEQERSGTGAERAKNLVSGSGAVSGCEKSWLERERSGSERWRSGERSGDRESQKLVLAVSGNSTAPAPLTCSGTSAIRRSRKSRSGCLTGVHALNVYIKIFTPPGRGVAEYCDPFGCLSGLIKSRPHDCTTAQSGRPSSPTART